MTINESNSLKKPLLIYDGDCGFCKEWIAYWAKLTQGHVDYAPSQEVGQKFPRISSAQFEKSVVLVFPSGEFVVGAKAVFSALAAAPHLKSGALLLNLYERAPFFDVTSEWAYKLVAEHRVAFSRMNQWVRSWVKRS